MLQHSNLNILLRPPPSPVLRWAQETGDYGETDSDDNGDRASPAGASGPGPPEASGDARGRGGGKRRRDSDGSKGASSGEARAGRKGRGRGSSGGDGDGGPGGVLARPKKETQGLVVPPPKARTDRIKAEAKEVKRAIIDNNTKKVW